MKKEKKQERMRSEKKTLKDTMDAGTHVNPLAWKDRFRILFGYRQTVVLRVEVLVEDKKKSEPAFTYKCVGSRHLVWKREPQHQGALVEQMGELR